MWEGVERVGHGRGGAWEGLKRRGVGAEGEGVGVRGGWCGRGA